MKRVPFISSLPLILFVLGVVLALYGLASLWLFRWLPFGWQAFYVGFLLAFWTVYFSSCGDERNWRDYPEPQGQPCIPPDSIFKSTPPQRICAWCGFVLSAGSSPASHTICPSCAEIHFPLERKRA